jgi:hypothetical protein
MSSSKLSICENGLQIRTREKLASLSYDVEIDAIMEGEGSSQGVEDIDTLSQVRKGTEEAFIESSWSKESRVDLRRTER